MIYRYWDSWLVLGLDEDEDGTRRDLLYFGFATANIIWIPPNWMTTTLSSTPLHSISSILTWQNDEDWISVKRMISFIMVRCSRFRRRRQLNSTQASRSIRLDLEFSEWNLFLPELLAGFGCATPDFANIFCSDLDWIWSGMNVPWSSSRFSSFSRWADLNWEERKCKGKQDKKCGKSFPLC